MELVAPEYFDTGEASLEATCHCIDQWMNPTPGVLLSLPLHGVVIKVSIFLTEEWKGKVIRL